MVLVPEVVDAVAPLPVLAAGGIANGRQLAAAMALGAQGVWTGSVWLTTEEAETHPVVKEKFLRELERYGPFTREHRKAGASAPIGMDRRMGGSREPGPTADAPSRNAHNRGTATGLPVRPTRKVAAPRS